jgi:cytochrome P450
MSEALAKLSLFDPAVQEDWYPAYRLLHEEAPVYWCEEGGFFVITKYADIQAVSREPNLFSTAATRTSSDPLIKHREALDIYERKGWPRFQPMVTDPPIHKQYRRNFDRFFSPSGVRVMEPFIRQFVDELIDGWIDRGECEFVHDFAMPLPMTVITKMLGFPMEDLPLLKRWSETWVMPFARGLSLEQEKYVAQMGVEFQHYIHEQAELRRRSPRDDVLTALVNGTVGEGAEERPLTENEIIGITDNLLIGGNETTTFALTSGIWLLFRFPDIHRELPQDPSKIRNFVEEVLRIESPTMGLMRVATEDTEIRGVRIPRGSVLNLRFAAGNRDEEQFPDAACPHLDRKNAAAHLAFGQAEHHCPGAALSRLEQMCAFEILLQRLADIRPAPGKNDYAHLPGFTLRGLKALHIEFDPA